MKIYKFKDLTDETKHCHFLQIVLKNSIWCARPDSLNDNEEFDFKLNYEPSAQTATLLSKTISQHGTTNISPHVTAFLTLENKQLNVIAAPIIENIVEKCRGAIGITSFSTTKDDVHLWKEYGGEGNGVCIEIEIPDKLLGNLYHKINYVSNKVFHVDSFLESVLFPDKAFDTYRNILLTKEKKWEKESEIRFIGKQQDISFIFDGRVNEITFGAKVPLHTLKKLRTEIEDHCHTNKIKISEHPSP